MQLVVEIGKSLFLEIIQVLLGCLAAFGLQRALKGKSGLVEDLNKEIILLPVLASLSGLILPMGIFGIAPIMMAAIFSGLRFSLVIPALASNFIFNTLAPFTEAGFSLKTGWVRIVMAFAFGLAAGWLARALKIDAKSFSRFDPELNASERLLPFINRYIAQAGMFLIIGVIIEYIFQKYYFYDLFNSLDITGICTVIFGFIGRYNIASPVFLVNIAIFYMVMNLKTLSGIIMMFKWKGVAGFYLYFIACVLVLSIVNIFVSLL